jgi:hypothetical protein
MAAPRYCIAAEGTPMSKREGGSASAFLTSMDNGVNTMKSKFLTALAVVFALASPAAAQADRPNIAENVKLNDTLFAILVADEIRKQCDTISGRVLKGIGMLWELVNDARDEGYSQEEIEAYRNSDEAKAALRERGDVLMALKGVSYEDPTTFCRWGRDEIADQSLIGSLLRAN